MLMLMKQAASGRGRHLAAETATGTVEGGPGQETGQGTGAGRETGTRGGAGQGTGGGDETAEVRGRSSNLIKVGNEQGAYSLTAGMPKRFCSPQPASFASSRQLDQLLFGRRSGQAVATSSAAASRMLRTSTTSTPAYILARRWLISSTHRPLSEAGSTSSLTPFH